VCSRETFTIKLILLGTWVFVLFYYRRNTRLRLVARHLRALGGWKADGPWPPFVVRGKSVQYTTVRVPACVRHTVAPYNKHVSPPPSYYKHVHCPRYLPVSAWLPAIEPRYPVPSSPLPIRHSFGSRVGSGVRRIVHPARVLTGNVPSNLTGPYWVVGTRRKTAHSSMYRSIKLYSSRKKESTLVYRW